ncbi:MAG: choice-of-anchor J domain-containing protein [Prevotella sp.]|nr:choice-of-anchor J domain-containing protein [Prevotella sp.]
MKRFTLFAIAALLTVVAFAQKQRLLPQAQVFQRTSVPFTPVQKAVKTTASHANRVAKVEGVDELVTLPAGAATETYYTASGNFYVSTESGWSNATADMPSVNVAVVGTDIYIQGLAYWFKEGWIKGTLEGTTATFPNGQLIGSDDYGDEFIVGSNDGSTVSDIVFTYDVAGGSLTAVTPYILESGAADKISAYCYWNSPVFTKEKPAGPEVVTLPEGVELVEYALTYETSAGAAGSGRAAVAVDGDDVYFQGFSSYIPDALIKGTKVGNTITFPADQYLGSYAGYDSYLYSEATFTYDEATDTYSSTDHVYSVLGGQYYDANYYNPVLKGIVEKAAMPANPEITGLTNSTQGYGYYITFNVPNVDVNGDGLVSSKLSYKIYTDIEKDVQPLTFTSATHDRLTEDMTEIPFGFTEGYDFYSTQIFLNDLYSADWNKIGIQSIYRGGDEENVTEIQWFDIKDYAAATVNATFDFNTMDLPTSATNVTDGDITENKTFVEGDVTLTISPKTTATTENRFWSTNAGPQLRMYSGELTISVPEGEQITQVIFNNSKWGNNTFNSGSFDTQNSTWTGSIQSLVMTVGGNTQINSIVVTVATGDEPGPEPGDEFNPDDIDLPAYVYDFNDGTLQGWTTIDADGDGYNWAPYSQAGVDGTDAVYSQSYNNSGALNPDNYLVSPKLALDGCITFYACAQDASYPAEHFGVFVSTKGNEDAADFEQAKEWTLTAARSFNAPRKVQGNWYRYDVDLRGYEGQEGYVAIRHFNCTDQFYMVVDNITLKSSKVQQPDIVVDPVEGLVDALSTINLTFNNYEVAIVEGESAQAELYLNDNFDEPIATAAINVAEGKYLTINFDEQTAKGEYTVLIPDGTIQNVTEGTILPDLEYHYSIYPKDIVTLPEGVEAETWYLTASASQAAYNVKNAEVQVAINGTDIYIQGINEPYLPEAWVKGTINEDGTATFETGQFFGTYTYQGADYDMWFLGTSNGSDVIDVTFNFDAENGLLTTGESTYIVISSSPNEFKAYEYYYDVEITRAQPVGPVEAPEGLETETYLFAAKQFVNPEEDGARKAVASAEATFDFNAMDVAVSSGSGATYNNAGDITEALPLTEGDVTLTVSPKDESASTPNRFWGTNNGPQLRVYSGTLTFEVPEGKTMSQIVFNNGKWNDDNVADAGEFDGATWTGDAQKVVVTIAGNTQINSIDVTLNGEGGGDEPVEDTDWEDYTAQVQVGFDGDDAYIQGLAQDCPELWVKATKNEAGQYVIPANQYMGTYDVGGYGWFIYDYYFTAVDEEGNLQDVVLNYDAETETFTTDQTLALNGDRKELYYYLLFQDVTISKMLEVAATPADPSVVGFNGTSSYPSVQFDIPAEDVDGNALMASKLFYTIWIEKDGVEQQLTLSASDYEALEEDMTEIPYTFGDDWDIYAGGSRVYLNMASDEILSWTKIGIQSIYRGAGEENKSNIVWVDVENGAITTGINIAKTDDLRNAVIYNLAGQRLQTLQKGLNIINGRKVVIK